MKIRTVKPEFWQSEKLRRISHGARLLFIGLFCMADDHGRFRAHPSLIRGEVFPYEEVATVEAWLGELVTLGVVRLYRVGEQSYGVVVNFAEHQKIDKRWASKLPPPPVADGPTPPPPPAATPPPAVEASHAAASPALAEGSGSLAKNVASLAEQSASLANSTPTDRIGSERNGTEPPQTRACAREGPGEPEPGKQSPEPTAGHPDGVIEIQRQLLFAGYRSNLKPHDRVRVVLARAIELHAVGMTQEQLGELIALDREKCKKGDGSLLATWIDRRQWRDVLAEQAMKAKEAGALARGAAANAAAADGQVAEPIPASSIVAGVLREAGGA